MKHFLTKDNISAAAVKSQCYADICRILGIPTRGNSYQRLRRLIIDFKCDVSHFENPRLLSIKRGPQREKRHWTEILVNGHKDRIKSYLIRRALIESGEPYVCKLCGLEPWWNGEELTLQVDHIDGNRTNSDKKNLRFLCPNCHTQQSNQYQGKRCEVCNKKITSKSKWCIRCQGSQQNKKKKVENRPSKDQILQDVKELGYRGTGRKYGVSDNAIRKWLK